MENRTYYDTLKARVRKIRTTGDEARWVWSITDSNGSRMAAGEEFTLKVAFGEAATAIGALRTWSIFSRGSVTPATDGRRWFSFESTEYKTTHNTIPTRKQLKAIRKLTKKLEKGKV